MTALATKRCCITDEAVEPITMIVHQMPSLKQVSPERADYLKWRSVNGAIGPLMLAAIAGVTQALALAFATPQSASVIKNPLVHVPVCILLMGWGSSAVTQSPWAVKIARSMMVFLVVLGLVEPFLPVEVLISSYPGGPPMFSTLPARVTAIICAVLALTALLWSRNAAYREFLAYIKAKGKQP